MIKTFRTIAFLEGISLILLVFIAMPLKHFMDMPAMVRYVGMFHGVLFMAYVFFLFNLKQELHFSWKEFAYGFVASIIPFGTFWFDKRLRTELS